MPRAGLAKEQLGKGGGLSFGEGNGEITAASVIMHQFPANKNTGEQEPLRPKMKLTLQRCDKDWKHTDDEPIEEFIPLLGSKAASITIRPGNANDANDEEPEDLGTDEGAEGNCIYVDEGAQVSDQSKAGHFVISLEEAGFKPEHLNGYMPNLIGLQAHFKTNTIKSTSEGIKDFKVFVVDKIQRFPYQKGGAKAAGKPAGATGAAGAGKSAAKPAASTKPAGKASPTAKAESNGDGDANSYAIQVLAAIGEKRAGTTMFTGKTGGQPADRIPSQVIMTIPKLKVPIALQKEVRALCEDPEFLMPQGMELGWEFGDDETVMIPEAS